MDYSLVVGVDSQRNELVVGIVGESQYKCLTEMNTNLKFRLYSYLYMGQETGKLGERIYFLRWRCQGRAHNCYSKAIQTTFLQCHGTLFPPSESNLIRHADVRAEPDCQVPDRWMKQKDTPEEDSHCLLELWPDW